MKMAQELSVGNVILVKDVPLVVQQTEYHSPGCLASVVKMKLRNLLTGAVSESVYKADERLQVLILEKKSCLFSYIHDDIYVFIDGEYNQHEIPVSQLSGVVKFLVEGIDCSLTFFKEMAISVELPQTVVLEIVYTEPVVRGDTTGKLMKMAKISTGHELQVASFCKIGDKIEIDTRTGEFRRRVNNG
ncbi:MULTISPECIES: elongation factor P [Candidatus Ichthyocystis]|uniref:elongation factor P n=1 Tax=Candidatus Ichthyocystis TaxID=2929841 RepID=UPI000A902DB6|nr:MULTISPECIES: elongation factor P [Ichthyocystis]